LYDLFPLYFNKGNCSLIIKMNRKGNEKVCPPEVDNENNYSMGVGDI
jgi:hypothetical protein